MACTMKNILTLSIVARFGPNPSIPTLRLVLDKTDSGMTGPKPGGPGSTIDAGASGEIPWSSNNGWSVWNVRDEKDNYYGSLTFTSDGNQVGLEKYAKGDTYWLIEPLGYGRPSATAYEIGCPNGVAHGPLIISNKGWTNGQGNELEVPTVGKNFWVLDYTSEEWSLDASARAIRQATDLSKYVPKPGSRAYPIHFDTGAPDWKVSGGVGCQKPGLEGLWQMDIQIGSDGRKATPWCETFYLAERRNMAWGAFNYGDGSTKQDNPDLII